MYSAVAARTREIATLRALGFGSGAIVLSLILESLALALLGGCVGGGGQPYGATNELRTKRAAGLYSEDQSGLWRCSHHNPYIKELYSEFLGEPAGHKAHELLHTTYTVLPEYKR